MQQVPDSSTIFSPSAPVKSGAKMDSADIVQAQDTVEAGDTSQVKKQVREFSYSLYKARREKEDSIQKAKDSLRDDSINKVIRSFDHQLQNAYSSLTKESVTYYESPPKKDDSSLNLGILLGCILLVAILWSRYRKRINLLIKCLFNWKLGKQVVRYEQVYSHPVNIILLIVFVISLSMFVIYAFSPFEVHHSNKIAAILLCCLLFIGVYIFKIIGLIVVGSIFEIRDATKEYIFHTLLLLKFCGLILVPVLVLFFYSNIDTSLIVSVGVAIILFSFLLRIYRGILIGLQLNERLLPIILYLCTLEILPALVIAKFLKDLYFS